MITRLCKHGSRFQAANAIFTIESKEAAGWGNISEEFSQCLHADDVG
jgi:hypothetical protein